MTTGRVEQTPDRHHRGYGWNPGPAAVVMGKNWYLNLSGLVPLWPVASLGWSKQNQSGSAWLSGNFSLKQTKKLSVTIRLVQFEIHRELEIFQIQPINVSHLKQNYFRNRLSFMKVMRKIEVTYLSMSGLVVKYTSSHNWILIGTRKR
jgi:hypothetical protein